MPAAAMVGFCAVDEKLLGPLHAYVAPASVVAVKLSVCPEQIELLLPSVGDDGGGFITTEVVPTVLVHPAAEVADTEYVPASDVVVTAIVGF